ncbi:hypothetical protein ACIP9H_14120, partial [Streptomyces sp. NPDC088732]|uniref:hypothetical protein n=2 Tax=unclassified Streptomyces TaxID=2593676 RepID=UPI0037F57F67
CLHESGTIGRNNPDVPSVLAVFFFKGTSPQTIRPGDGVSTYLALTFGTLLSSQGTEASFETVSPAPPGFPFVVSSLADPISFSATLWRGFRLGVSAPAHSLR